MRVLLTGATGFLISHVADRLVKEGHEVTALVRWSSDVAHLQQLGCKLVYGSLGEPKSLEAALRSQEIVLHGAGAIKARRPDEFYRVNAIGTKHLVEAAAAVARDTLVRFVFVSSIAAQGPSMGRGPRSSRLPPKPVSAYGKSKLAAEAFVLGRGYELPVTILRPPPIYGPRDTGMLPVFKMIASRLNATMGDPAQRVSMIYVDDAVEAVVRTMTMDHPSGAVYPIDDGKDYSQREIGSTIARAMGVSTLSLTIPTAVAVLAAHGAQIFGDITGQSFIFGPDKVLEMRQPGWVCGHAKIADDLGFEPRVLLPEGAARTAEWYRANGWI